MISGFWSGSPWNCRDMMLIQLDLRSLANLRRANRRFMQAVDVMPQYQKIARVAIQGALSINTGSSFSCQELYNELHRAECRSCGDFGGYLYLIYPPPNLLPLLYQNRRILPTQTDRGEKRIRS
ncbi:uncharacterized protein BDV17DRAFT_166790 [Aspergillus undulatus]|uniref:uncharacterized protein n=1 Tax=Aspergillus undulatus TaxID=1810928 RepID=UPI003CCD0551